MSYFGQEIILAPDESEKLINTGKNFRHGSEKENSRKTRIVYNGNDDVTIEPVSEKESSQRCPSTT